MLLGSLLLANQLFLPGVPYGSVEWKTFVISYSMFILLGLILLLLRRIEDPFSHLSGFSAVAITVLTSVISASDTLVTGDLSAFVVGLIVGGVAFRANLLFHGLRSIIGLMIHVFGTRVFTGSFPAASMYILLAAFIILSISVTSVLDGYANRAFSLQAELEAFNLHLRDISLRDKLTGLYNRHFLDETLDKLKRASKRNGTLFSVIIVDIDFFKKVNDEFGHPKGDLVICAIAETLISVTRGNDFVGRFGGEEFLLILPETGIQGAVSVGTHLLNAVRSLVPDAIPRPVTVSAGIAEYSSNEEAIDVLKRADELLYKAKNGGRDRLEYK
jgi:diguanylate cyclase (GGDEF)-like protein